MENIKIVSPKTAGEKERIKRLQKRGLKANFTDFANALRYLYNWTFRYPMEYTSNEDKTEIAIDSSENYISFINNYVGIRPVIDYNKISSSCYDTEDLGDGITREKYGEYPKSKVSVDELIHICKKARSNLFKPTGKRYTIHERTLRQLPITVPTCRYPYPSNNDIKVVSLREFIDDEGNKFVKYNNNWYKVEPVTMLVDRENNIAVTEDVIYSTLPYEKYNIRRISILKENPYEELEEFLQEDSLERLKLDQTRSLKGFINNVLLKDLIPSEVDLKELFPEEQKDEEFELDPIVPSYPPQQPFYPWNPLVPYVKTPSKPKELQLTIK